MNESSRTEGVVIILGMHRSGTSCIAGSLEESGLYLGEVNQAAPHNAKGNRENIEIMNLHDAVLTANGCRWDAPPEAATWNADHKARRDAIIATYPANKVWGFKDPRTLLTLDGWLEVLPTARCVGTFRHPMAVAQSLQRRNGFAIEQGFALWQKYNQILLDRQKRIGYELVCFNWPESKYRARLAAIALGLNLEPPPKSFSFFDERLRNTDISVEISLPGPVIDLYERLKEISA